MSRGLAASSTSGPSPQPSIAPGRKFSISTSAFKASWRTISCASGSLRLSASERLLRDCICHQTEVPSLMSRQLRSGSPPSGLSILTTSAPKSARVLAAKGPAISWPSSRTLSPLSGPLAGAAWSAEWGRVGFWVKACELVIGLQCAAARARRLAVVRRSSHRGWGWLGCRGQAEAEGPAPLLAISPSSLRVISASICGLKAPSKNPSLACSVKV